MSRKSYSAANENAATATGTTGTWTMSAGDIALHERTRDTERVSKTLLEDDPLNFRQALKSDGELTELRKRSRRGKRVAHYQSKQNALIQYLLKPMDEHTEEATADEDASRLPVKIAVWSSLIANFGLCILQMYAAISSVSLSLLATGIDSVFDIGSNILLFYAHRKAARLDANRWPVGGARLENIGNIIYGFLMLSVSLIVIVESSRTLITKDDSNTFNIAAIAAVAAALGVKFVLFLISWPYRGKSSQVQVLWEDHRNDLFINSFGILMATAGSKWIWWLDPMGAIIIGAGIVGSWGRTIYLQFRELAGMAAPHDFIQLIIYKVMTFSDEISQVDTVRAYHSGPSYFVEVDIVMDADTPLYKAHDVSQQLQDKIELLPNVERCFVHVDHETTHRPEHRKNI